MSRGKFGSVEVNPEGGVIATTEITPVWTDGERGDLEGYRKTGVDRALGE